MANTSNRLAIQQHLRAYPSPLVPASPFHPGYNFPHRRHTKLLLLTTLPILITQPMSIRPLPLILLKTNAHRTLLRHSLRRLEIDVRLASAIWVIWAELGGLTGELPVCAGVLEDGVADYAHCGRVIMRCEMQEVC